MPAQTIPLEVRLWRRVQKSGPDDCWLWLGAHNGKGYGHIGRGGRGNGNEYVHRVAWELEHGPIPEGLEIDHLCRVRNCVNPRHLELVTHRENNRRGETMSAIRGRQTHCLRGHPFDEANTYQPPGRTQHRMCRACMRISAKKSRLKRQASGAAT